MASERTYVMIKPDGVQRGLVGEIIKRFETKGFALKGVSTPFALLLARTPSPLASLDPGWVSTA